MICELRASAYVDRKGRRLWSGNGMVFAADFLIAPNALDWLWQKINGVNGKLWVFKEGDVLRIVSGDETRGDCILFSGTAREIVQQLRPYMVMMEGS